MLPNFWNLLWGENQHCEDPFVLTWAPLCCHWASSCNFLRCFCYHSTHIYYTFTAVGVLLTILPEVIAITTG